MIRNFSHTNLHSFFKIQTVIKSHSLMLGTSNFATLVFSICSFHFWHCLSYSPKYKRFLGKLSSRDPSCKEPIVIWCLCPFFVWGLRSDDETVRKFEVALNPMCRICLNFTKSCISSCLSNFIIRKKFTVPFLK